MNKNDIHCCNDRHRGDSPADKILLTISEFMNSQFRINIRQTEIIKTSQRHNP